MLATWGRYLLWREIVREDTAASVRFGHLVVDSDAWVEQLVVVVIDLGDGAVVSLWEIQTQSDIGFGFGACEHASAEVASIEPDADLLNALFLACSVVVFVVSQGAPEGDRSVV